jgi:chemotaxis protein CheC
VMIKMDFSKLSDLQVDALREIGNIGAGNAATALAQMVNARVEINVPRVNILPFQDVSQLVGGPGAHVAGVYVRVSGSAAANVLFILPVDNATRLVDMMLMRKPGTTWDFGEMESSVLEEVGNIICGTYLSALSAFTQLTFASSVPALAIDMAGNWAIISGGRNATIVPSIRGSPMIRPSSNAETARDSRTSSKAAAI